MHQTEEAVLIFDGDNDYWVPKSCIEDSRNIDFESITTINIAVWFAKKEGLI